MSAPAADALMPQSNEFVRARSGDRSVPAAGSRCGIGACEVIDRPDHMAAFEFVVVSSLRAVQLVRGCTPRVPAGHRHTTTARAEVATGMVRREPAPPNDKPVA